jgi:hypothetical protein
MIDRTAKRMRGWPAFVAWSAGAGVLTVGLISSLFVILVPGGVILLAVVANRARLWPEVAGIPFGVGVATLTIALLHAADIPCGDLSSPQRLSRGEHFSCTSFHSASWVTVGIVGIAVSMAMYGVGRAAGRRSATMNSRGDR